MDMKEKMDRIREAYRNESEAKETVDLLNEIIGKICKLYYYDIVEEATNKEGAPAIDVLINVEKALVAVRRDMYNEYIRCAGERHEIVKGILTSEPPQPRRGRPKKN